MKSRAAKESKYHDGIQNDIQDSANDQGYHGQDGISNCLQQPLGVGLQENAPAVHQINGEVLPAKFLQIRFRRQFCGNHIGKENSRQREYKGCDQHQA